MVSTINSERAHGNLSSAIRLFVLDHYRNMIGTADVETPGRESVQLRAGECLGRRRKFSA
jgi:hypothetical protein